VIDLTNEIAVKEIQSSLRTLFNSACGKDAMHFLEQICGWFDFSDVEPNMILIKHGKRQVLATIKTLLDLNPQEIVALTKGEDNG